ncbi:hypothetical protein OHA72_40065 [Dactylosporangium sp. NBC_01737]|uniref:hypothetical protein n=1 Tax=Dactylosporangium sp. NBC_01737 TaxID=2975959 RepID=UPI002E12EC4D|nr:hypothetical protein OHA72_40065 [Dactylosporangium sp. NBC_01737]
MRPEDVLAQTDWSAVQHSYDGDSVSPSTPEILAALLDGDAGRRDQALSDLYSMVHHSGSLCSATAPAVTFAVAALGDPRTLAPVSTRDGVVPVRAALLRWVASVMRAAAEPEDRLAGCPDDVAACRALRPSVYPAAVALRTDADPVVAGKALQALHACLLDAPELAHHRSEAAGWLRGDALAALDVTTRVVVVVSLQEWGYDTTPVIASDPDPLVRAAAALSPVHTGGAAGTRALRDALIEADAAGWYKTLLPPYGPLYLFRILPAAVDRVPLADLVPALDALLGTASGVVYQADEWAVQLRRKVFPFPDGVPLGSDQRALLDLLARRCFGTHGDFRFDGDARTALADLLPEGADWLAQGLGSVSYTAGTEVSDLDTRFQGLAGEYASRRSAAHDAVVRWDWYSHDAFDLRPLHYERDLRKPGRPLAERPPLDRDHCRIGFDAADRPVAFLEYSGFLHGRLYYETYRDHDAGAGLVEQAHFYADGTPIYLHRYRFEAGRIRSATTVARHGGGYEAYRYTGPHVTWIWVYHGSATGTPGRRLEPVRPFTSISAEHDADGLRRLEVHSGDAADLRYERPPPAFTVDEACRAVHRELVRTIPATVAALAADGAAYCVVLAYASANPLDVLVHVGLDADRRTLLAQGSGDAVWNPDDLAAEAQADLDAVADTARLLGQELALIDAEDVGGPRPRGSERARRLFCAVAADLNTLDWTGSLPPTDDFVVYAVDVELADLERNLPACLPPDRLALLRDRGLLQVRGPG